MKTNKLRYELYTLYVNAYGEVTNVILWGKFFSLKDAYTLDIAHRHRLPERTLTAVIDTDEITIDRYLKKLEAPFNRIGLLHSIEEGILTLNNYHNEGTSSMNVMLDGQRGY